MSTSTRTSSTSLNGVQLASVNAYSRAALSYRNTFASDAEWARSYARSFYHDVDSSIGFLPVYHNLLNTLYNTVAEKSTTVKASAKSQTHEHPLLPTPQTQSEGFVVKMDKLFKYAWPLVGEYRSLERWAKVQAAQWQMKGNVSHKLAEVAAKLLEMAETQLEKEKSSTPNYVELSAQHWGTRKNFTSNTAWAKETSKHVYQQLDKKVDRDTIQSGLLEAAKNITAPVVRYTKTAVNFEDDFDVMVDESLINVKHFADEKAWARATARNFYHQFGGTTPFITIYSELLLKNEEANENEDDSTYVSESEEEEDSLYEESEDDDESLVSEESEDETESEGDDDETLSYTSHDSADEKADSLFTPPGKMTSAEAKAGQLAMNRVLFKEYRGWYQSFEEEEDDEFSAEDRFSWHCAKILARKSGLDREMCQKVVGGWLLLHKKTLKTL